MKNKVLAFIPARANSKSVKKKNIKTLCKRPLISWTIDFAKKLKFIDYILLVHIKNLAQDDI